MNLEYIKTVQKATVLVGYSLAEGAPEWCGTGFLVGDGTNALTCYHVVKGRKKTVMENGTQKKLCCFLFWYHNNTYQFIKLPIEEMFMIPDLELGSSYFGERNVDVARLRLDTSEWQERVPQETIPTVQLEEHITPEEVEIGDDIAQIGYPSPSILVARKGSKSLPNQMEPLVQFGKISGILPSSSAPLPHLLALDILSAGGSSGSPVVRLSDGRVIAMTNQLLLSLWDKAVLELEPGQKEMKQRQLLYPVPTGITFAVPSNLFYGFGYLSAEEPRFEIKSRWEAKGNERSK